MQQYYTSEVIRDPSRIQSQSKGNYNNKKKNIFSQIKKANENVNASSIIQEDKHQLRDILVFELYMLLLCLHRF